MGDSISIKIYNEEIAENAKFRKAAEPIFSALRQLF
jgi:hypothetical protein